MWYLKIKYRHKDCLYTEKIHELGITMHHYYLGSYTKEGFVYTNAFQKIEGEQKATQKYVTLLKKERRILKIEQYENALLLWTKNKQEKKTYTTLYNPMFLYPEPATIDKSGFEIVHIAFWRKEELQKVIHELKKDKVTVHFEILSFVQKKQNDIYIAKILPKLAAQQKKALLLAYEWEYYSFPRKIGLEELSKRANISKATFRENLRKAEEKILPLLIAHKKPSLRGRKNK